MAGVDNRIVSIKFDNAAFEKNVADTLVSLDRLRQSIDATNSGHGLNDLSSASRNFNLDGMTTSIDGVSAKFLALATVGITALSTIVSHAISAGSRMLSAFTFDPISAGFKEFETNMNSIQTILSNTSSKGTDLDDVSKALDNLNTYSDQTIYNFGQMARNIGTFTAAGVDLDRATQSIKGIANLAALSGSNAEQASTAMYQLSQAISAGSVKLMDWNSVTNAGIGGEVFKKALFETGKALGTLANVPMDTTFEQWEKAGGPFRSTLSKVADDVDDTADAVSQATRQSAKDIASAQKAQANAAQSGAESIERAEKSKVKAFERASKSIENAVESQKRVIESNAKSSQNAIERITAAQEALKKALEPTSAEDLQAATDTLTVAQFDQAEVAKDVIKAEKEQKRVEDSLLAARKKLDNAKDPKQRAFATLTVAVAERDLLAATEAVARARIKQNSATRSLHQAETSLIDAKKKGSKEDENVIDSTKDLADAEADQVRITEENNKRALDAAESIRDAEVEAAEIRKDAVDAVADAQESAAERNIAASERVAEATERAADRIKAANESTDGPKIGWLTDKVLTSTLAAFTGDLDEAQLMAMGYSKAQAQEMMRLGKIGKAAATEIKTLTQLLSTVKESIGSGWSQTFRVLVGDFNESKKLFTDLNNSIGGFISKSADARNELFKGWKDLGGRDALLEGFKNAFKAIHELLGPIVQGFRDIFPPLTVQRFVQLTEAFERFTKGLIITKESSDRIRRTFAGLFAVVEIGWTVFKGIVGVIAQVIRSLTGVGSGVLGATATFGDFLVALNKVLVDGKGIERFFTTLGDVIQAPIEFIKALGSAIFAFFRGFSENKTVADGLAGIEDRFSSLAKVSDRLSIVWGNLSARFEGFGEAARKLWEGIKDWFSELGKRISEAIGPNEFESVFDAINTGLLAGITVLIAKFLKNGFKFDIGGGLLGNISKSFKELTGALKAMALDVKAKALLKIAAAVAILTASLLVLSTINSQALTAALLAMTAGFSELVAVFAMLNALTSGPMAAVKLTILSVGLIALSTAMLLLSVAIKNLSSLDWNELTTGLAGAGAGLALMVAAMKFLPPTPGMIASGIAMIAIATAMLLLSKAVKSFSDLSWGEMAKGLVGVAGGLAIIVTAMSFMPPGMIAAGIGLIAVATALKILAAAVQSFANISWADLGKGLLGIGGALAVVAGAMWLMPPNMIATSIALVILSGALNSMARAVGVLGSMNMAELAKGLGAIAVMLAILAVAMIAMTGTIAGAAALLVVSGALLILSGVLKILGGMSLKEIAIGLGAIAAMLAVLGVGALLLTPVIPLLLSLGGAMVLLGTGMILFGAGAYLAAKAFAALAKAGKVGVAVLIEMIKMAVTALPEIAQALAKSILDFAEEILKGTPVILKLMTALILQLTQTIIKLSPEIAKALAVFITQGLALIREKFPDILETGFQLLLTFLKGVRDHIGEIVAVAVEMVVTLVDAIAENSNKLVAAAARLIISFVRGIGDQLGRIVTAGVDIVLALLRGITDNIVRFANAAFDIVIGFVNALAKVIEEKTPELIKAGVHLVEAIGKGILKGLEEIPVVGQVLRLGESVLSGLADVFGIKSPSKEFMKIGRYAIQGLSIGLQDASAENAAVTQGETLIKAFQESINKQAINLSDLGDFNPVITPVLDLTKVRYASRELNGLMSVSTIAPNVSYDRARSIEKTTDFQPKDPEPSSDSGPKEVTFQQNIYAPTALTTNDIYRSTKSQIALAKEELSIP